MDKATRFNGADYDPLKAKFLRGTLQEEGEFIVDYQDEVISRQLVERTAQLKTKRGFSVAESGEGYKLDIHFLKYLRFLDIKGVEGEQVILYNRLVYGRLTKIASTLQFGYTDEIKAMMAEYYDNLQLKA